MALAKQQNCARWRIDRDAVNACRVCKRAYCNRCCAGTMIMLTLADRTMICVDCAEEALNEHFKVRG
jgi:hypothetical protein